jgi:large subunit ribosomal protein L16
MHRGNRAGLAYRGNTVAFGEYGLMATERCWLDTKQIEAARGGHGFQIFGIFSHTS